MASGNNPIPHSPKKTLGTVIDGEVIKIDRKDKNSVDHRDRPHDQYPEEFKQRVVRAASVRGVKLTWVGLRFNVLPEIIQTWLEQYKRNA